MRKLSYLLPPHAAINIAACGDSGRFVDENAGTTPGPGGNISVSVVNVLSSSPSLPSDAGQTVDMMVVVRDDTNDENQSPPGQISPFGIEADCTNLD